jgi:glycerol kinase
MPKYIAALKIDGGMVNNHTLMQFQADLLGIPVTRPAVNETTALGAAFAAGLAVGFWQNLHELRGLCQAQHTWQAQMDVATRERLYAGWNKAVGRSLGWVEAERFE